MTYVRKNQAQLSDEEWRQFIDAIDDMHGIGTAPPPYRLFVRVHVDGMTTAQGMTWGVHTMPEMGMVGRNFLAWHRQYILRLERRLRRANQNVTLPYWDWIEQPNLPEALNDPMLLDRWNITREWDPRQLPIRAELQAVKARTTFRAFQLRLEMVHGSVHVAVGGTMATASSPADPLFWLHHANVDRIWAEWQTTHPDAVPPNGSEVLQPPSLFGNRVSDVLRISELGYSYT